MTTFSQLALIVMFLVVQCASIPQNSNIRWLKAENWPDTQLGEQLRHEKGESGEARFHLLAYLPHRHDKSFCKGIMQAILFNIKHDSIEHIHLFRHNDSCININYLPQSLKINVHVMAEEENITFVSIMKFVAQHCQHKNLILARANMYFPASISIFTRVGIRENDVHLLKSIHPSPSYNSPDNYYGRHYALIFRGIWDMIDDYPNSIKALSFELDSPRLDNENVLKKIFEQTLRMTLIASDIKAICSHE